MLSPTERQQYQEQGFVILPNFLETSALTAIEPRLDAFDEEYNQKIQGSKRDGISRPNEIPFTANLAQKDPVLHRFIASDPSSNRAPKSSARMSNSLGIKPCINVPKPSVTSLGTKTPGMSPQVRPTI